MHKVNEADLAFFAWLDEDCAAAIPEENTRGAVGVVGHARVGVCSADKLPPAWGNTSVTFDQYGNLFVAYLSTSTSTYTDFALSTDGGATFSHQLALAKLTDQPVVAAGHGSVWVPTTRAG